MLPSKELVLGLTLALESSAVEIERARVILNTQPDAVACQHADLLLAKAWLRIDNARRALDPSTPVPE
jgi:hypothetical protein